MNQKQLQDKLNQEDLALVADIQGTLYSSHSKGIAPILNPMKEKRDFFHGAKVVDRVIGKAAAMLLVLSGVKYIHAIIISEKAKGVLEKYHIDFTYHRCVEYIMNRDHTGMCPMEQTVYDIDDLDEAFLALIQKQIELMK